MGKRYTYCIQDWPVASEAPAKKHFPLVPFAPLLMGKANYQDQWHLKKTASAA
jgi:hypothetical protein